MSFQTAIAKGSCPDQFDQLPFDGTTEDVILEVLEGFNTPRALAVWLLFKYVEHDQLLSLELPDHELYSTAVQFFADYQSTVLLRKSTFLLTSVDKRKAALDKLAQAEGLCRASNQRILSTDRGECPALDTLISRVKRKIIRVLGNFDLDEFADSAGWGPGATFSLPRKRATPVDKMLEHRISVTPGCYLAARALIGRDIHWCQARGIPAEGPVSLLECEFELVNGNKVVTVPKDARSDRPIAIEPTANLFLQKGMGSMIRRRLKRIGIDLNDQSRNASLAEFGSRDGSLSTIDLSSASDTISRELVRRVLPDDWAVWADRLRSHHSFLEGSWSRNEKFSSMGNGFTFELESLIFWAVSSLHDRSASVYGDDIVVQTSCYREVTRDLESLGFLVNHEKSFSTGFFRESCGSHFFRGTNVKPLYIKERPYVDVVDTLNFINGLLYLSERFGVVGFEPTILSAWRRAKREFDLHVFTVYDGERTLPIGVAYPKRHRRLDAFYTFSRATGRLRLPGLSYKPGRFVPIWVDALLAYSLRFSPEVAMSHGIPTKRGGRYVVRQIALNG